MKLSICIPMYNEAACAADTAAKLKEAARALVDSGAISDFEIIFSDDGSVDGCYDLVPEGDGIVKIRSEKNTGKGGAVRRAVAASTGDAVLYTDCDLAYGTDVIGEAVRQYASQGVTVLVGSRAKHPEGYEGYTFVRRVASKAYLLFLRVFAGFGLSDSQCGFKLFEGECARRVFSLCECDGWAFDFEALMIAKKTGASFGELPVKIINHGESRINVVSDSVKMLRELAKIKKRVKKLEV